ncbi:MAG: phosphoribosylanthranilate isomerase [bacterium]
MTRVPVKICGVRDAGAIDAAVEGGARAVGFVFSSSPRCIGVDEAMTLARRVPDGVWRVGVFREIDTVVLAEVAQRGIVTHVQAEWMDESVVRAHSPGLAFIPVYRDVPTLRVELGEEATREPRAFLVESAVSGVGMVPVWGRIARAGVGLAGVPGRAFILAGGLKPVNVRGAILATGAGFVDVSSGVERSLGVKDAGLIGEFLAEARGGFAEASQPCVAETARAGKSARVKP